MWIWCWKDGPTTSQVIFLKPTKECFTYCLGLAMSASAVVSPISLIPRTEQLWAWGLGFFAAGYWLIFKSSPFLINLEFFTGIELFRKVAYNNFLFIRLGDVCVLFGGFILANDYLKKGLWTTIGSKTLEIYIVHYFILYGSLFGLGLYKFFKYSWTFPQAIVGALLFMLVCSALVLLDGHYRPKIRTFFSEKWRKA